MKKYLFCILIFVFSFSNLYADYYIVTKTGKGIWARSVKQKSGNVIYTEKKTGKSVTISISKLDGVLPQVKRGKKYTDAYIQKQIGKIKKVIRKHRKVLLRPLNNLLQEWEMLMKPSADIEKGIPRIEGVFNNSKKDTGDYKTAHLALGMLKYKDMRNAYVKDIDGAMDRVEKEYIAVSLENLNKWASDSKMSLYVFSKVKKLGLELSDIMPEDKKSSISGIMDMARKTVIDYTSKHVLSYFMKNKDVDGYLYGIDLLRQVRDDVAADEAEKAAASKSMAGFIKNVDKVLTGYSIEPDGYPIAKAHKDSVSEFMKYGRFVTFTNTDLDEEALFVTSDNPGVVNTKARDWSFGVKVFFNRPQPEGRLYGIMVRIPGAERTLTEVAPFLTEPEPKNGSMEVRCDCNLNWVPDDHIIATDESGRSYLYITLVGKDSDNANWKYLGQTCKLKAK